MRIFCLFNVEYNLRFDYFVLIVLWYLSFENYRIGLDSVTGDGIQIEYSDFLNGEIDLYIVPYLA